RHPVRLARPERDRVAPPGRGRRPDPDRNLHRPPAPHTRRPHMIAERADPRRAPLLAMFDAAVAAASPAARVPAELPPPPRGRLILLAGGKAAAAMTEAALAHYRRTAPDVLDRIAGLCVTRPGYGGDTRPLKLVEAGHPVPDAAGVAATA